MRANREGHRERCTYADEPSHDQHVDGVRVPREGAVRLDQNVELGQRNAEADGGEDAEQVVVQDGAPRGLHFVLRGVDDILAVRHLEHDEPEVESDPRVRLEAGEVEGLVRQHVASGSEGNEGE
mgnify:CR=1 FL=1